MNPTTPEADLLPLLARAAGATLAEQLETIAKDGPAGIRVLEDTATGRGMPAERIVDMLRPYTRMNHDDKEEGLGIGLSVVQKAAERLGHGLHIDSHPGKGTTATVSLGAPRPPATPQVVDGAPSFAPGTWVALVDDNPEVREALAELLRRWGLEVEQARSGAELRDRLDARALGPGRSRPDVLITDYALGGEDGLEIAAAVRQRPGLEDLPVLMVTGSVSAQVQALAEAQGIAVLLKPARPSRLRTALRRCLAGRVSAPQA